MSNQFVINLDELPTPVLEGSWEFDEIWKCGDWSFSMIDDADVEYAERAIYAWLGWWKYLKEVKRGTETEG